MGKLQFRRQHTCWFCESFINAFPKRIFSYLVFLFVCLNEGPRNTQMCKLLGKAVKLVITLHLILQKSKLLFKNKVYTGGRN